MRDAYSPRPRSFAFFPSLVCRSHAAAAVRRFAMGVIVNHSPLKGKRQRISGLSMCGQTRYSSAVKRVGDGALPPRATWNLLVSVLRYAGTELRRGSMESCILTNKYNPVNPSIDASNRVRTTEKRLENLGDFCFNHWKIREFSLMKFYLRLREFF